MQTARSRKRISKHPHRQRAHANQRVKGPRISRAKLQTLRENLEGTQVALDHTLDRFWVVPEHDVLGTLARTKKEIGKAVSLLSKAA